MLWEAKRKLQATAEDRHLARLRLANDSCIAVSCLFHTLDWRQHFALYARIQKLVRPAPPLLNLIDIFMHRLSLRPAYTTAGTADGPQPFLAVHLRLNDHLKLCRLYNDTRFAAFANGCQHDIAPHLIADRVLQEARVASLRAIYLATDEWDHPFVAGAPLFFLFGPCRRRMPRATTTPRVTSERSR